MKISEGRTEPKILKSGASTTNKKTNQFQRIKTNKEVTLKTRETYFLYRKPQKLKIAKRFVLLGNWHSAKKRKVESYLRINKLGVSLKNELK